MRRRKTIRTLALALLLVAGAAGAYAAWNRAWIAYYMSCIDEQPLLAGAALRRIGSPSLLPLARQVAVRFDTHPIQPNDLKRFRLIEEIVRDDPDAAVTLFRDSGESPDVRWMLATLAAPVLTTQEKWEVAAHWAGRESPWTKEMLFHLEVGPGCNMRDDALRRLHSDEPTERYAAALALVHNSQCEASLEAARLVCKVTKRQDWYELAARRLLLAQSPQDLPVFEHCLIDGSEALRREVLWTLRYHAQAAEIPTLLRAVAATTGSMRRDCLSLLVDTVSEQIVQGGDLGNVLQELEPFLEDPDPAIRGMVVDVLHPDHIVGENLAARITSGLTPQELVDNGLHDLLPRPRLVEVARVLAGDSSAAGAARYRDVALGVFPPLAGQDLLELLAAARGENREVTLRGFLRLTTHARRPSMAALVDACAADPSAFGAPSMQALACRSITGTLDEEHVTTLAGLLWRVVDPEGAANEALRSDTTRREAAAALARALGGEGGRRALQALVEQTEGEENERYRVLLSECAQ